LAHASLNRKFVVVEEGGVTGKLEVFWDVVTAVSSKATYQSLRWLTNIAMAFLRANPLNE
jgi:hypothetical protein